MSTMQNRNTAPDTYQEAKPAAASTASDVPPPTSAPDTCQEAKPAAVSTASDVPPPSSAQDRNTAPDTYQEAESVVSKAPAWPRVILASTPVWQRAAPHWDDAGPYWATKHFHNAEGQTVQCNYCSYQFTDHDGTSIDKIVAHLETNHSIHSDVPIRVWATDMFDGLEIAESLFCCACRNALMCRALNKHQMDACCCCCCLTDLVSNCLSMHSCNFPLHCLATTVMRHQTAYRQNIKENCLKGAFITLFCLPCSQAQVFRELTAAGAYPGSVCCCDEVPVIPMKMA